jgi:biotin carboxyl carrier protein
MRTQRVKDKIWVQWNGRLYALPVELRPGRSAGQEDSAELVAPFPCKILKVHAKPGQSLRKGDPVLVVEAMKMEYAYSSPRDGVVEAVPVKEGEIVSGGTPFVRWKGQA